ncbi:MAG: hypothetical protein ACREMF_01610 [Gemmatimonadales bacterium]
MPRLVAVLVAAALGCASPEAVRERGGGPGADLGNRGPVVIFHDGAEPYYRTPCVTKPVQCQGPAPIFSPSWNPD